MLRDGVETWESAYQKAHSEGNEAACKSAEHQRSDFADQIKTLMNFKNGLGRFCRTYAYVAQLIDFCDPELENFSAFAKLLYKRLDGDSPENIDLRGLVLTGFDIKTSEGRIVVANENPVLQPVGPGGGDSPSQSPHYLSEIIDRLNHLFGDVTSLQDQVVFVNHIVAIAKENDVVMAQVENNTREQALKGNLPGAVQQGVVRALMSHQKLATLVLKSDRQSMSALTDMIYDLIHNNRTINLDDRSV